MKKLFSLTVTRTTDNETARFEWQYETYKEALEHYRKHAADEAGFRCMIAGKSNVSIFDLTNNVRVKELKFEAASVNY